MSTQTPPEKCPVCESKPSTANHVRILFGCGAGWSPSYGDDGWFSPCAYAMTAALRCRATLHPTPLEQARAALVDAAIADVATWSHMVHLAGDDQERAEKLLPSLEGSDVALTLALREHDEAANAYRDAVIAYIAARSRA